MKIFTQKKILKKLIMLLMLFAIFTAVLPSNVSFAANKKDPGGKLMKPIMDFLIALGDFIMDLIHNVIYGMNTALIRVDLNTGLFEIIVIAVAVIAATAAVIALSSFIITTAVPALMGALTGIFGEITVAGLSAATVGSILVAAAGTGVVTGIYVQSAWFSDEAVLPLYKITPEEIFTGQVPMLSPNFFSDKNMTLIDETQGIINKNKEGEKSVNIETKSGMWTQNEDQNKAMNDMLKAHGYTGSDINAKDLNGRTKGIIAKWDKGDKAYQAEVSIISSGQPSNYVSGSNTYPGGGSYAAGSSGGAKTVYVTVYSGEWKGSVPIAQSLKNVIARWYYNIRTVALVAMMVILIYIGIRMMLCGIASQKAKYKNMFVDWLVAMCLMLVMHYIMVFAMNVSESIVSVFSSMNNQKEYLVEYEYDSKIEKALTSLAEADGGVTDAQFQSMMHTVNGKKFITWDARNLMGVIRVEAALSESGTYVYWGYALSFLVLVWYTLFFLWTYIRRILYLAFFTIIAPFVAMTYPLDKIHDGKAQAFDMWLKEYIINLLIPIVHTVLYTILINSAYELASTNIIYTLVAIGFMMPAEKFVRKMFGFDRAETPGLLGGAAGAAVALSAFNHILKPRKGLGGSGNDKDAITDGSEKNKNAFKKKTNIDTASSIFGDAKPDTGTPIPKGTARDYYLNRKNKKGPVKGTARDYYLNRKNGHNSQINARRNAGKSAIFGGGNILKNTNLGRAITGASKDWARQKLQRTANSLASGKPIRAMATTAERLFFGAGGAALGATLGMASGEFSKTAQNAGTLGIAASSVIPRGSKSDVDMEEVMEEYERGLYGDDYDKVKLEEQRKKTIENEKNLKELRRYLNLEDLDSARAVLRKHGDCIDAGMEMEDIATIEKLINDDKMDKDLAKTAYKYYKKAGDRPSNMGPKENEKLRAIFSNAAKNEGVAQDKLGKAVDNMIDHVEMYGKYKSGLDDIE